MRAAKPWPPPSPISIGAVESIRPVAVVATRRSFWRPSIFELGLFRKEAAMIYSIPRSTSAQCRWNPPPFWPFCRARVRPGKDLATTLAARASAQHADPPRRILLRPPERHHVGAPDVSRADPDRGQRRGIGGRQHPGDLPAPVSCQRDADSRLVGLVFDSASLLPAPVTNRWLVAVDG